MGLINFIKNRGFQITLFSTGKLKHPNEIKRTTAREDIKRRKKDELESTTGVGKETSGDV